MIDIIIATYNRKDKVIQLIKQINSCKVKPDKIIVVDASELECVEIQEQNCVYVRSTHKNQPYQRFLGAKFATSDFILFLDDDMEILYKDYLSYIQENILNSPDISGFALHFENKHEDSVISKLPKSRITFGKMGTIIKILSGYPNAKTGQFCSCGVKGIQPQNGGKTQWVSGGAFVAKKENLFSNFNFQLFDLFEVKLGMGEDAIIGFSLSRQGDLKYLPKLLFIHNDQKNSTYTPDLRSYGERVTYSRLYLTLERARLNSNSLLLPIIHFHWYTFNRIVGQLINLVIKPNKNRLDIFNGTLDGWVRALRFNFDSKLQKKTYWEGEVLIDVKDNLLDQ